MENITTVSFYLRGKTVYARVNGGQRKVFDRFSTQIKLSDSMVWAENECVAGKSREVMKINNLLTQKKAEILKTYKGVSKREIKSVGVDFKDKSRVKSKGTHNLDLQKCFEDYISRLESGDIVNKDTHGKMSDETIDLYKNVLRILNKHFTDPVSLKDMSIPHAGTFEEKASVQNYTEEVLGGVIKTMIKEGLKKSSQSTYFSKIKKVISHYAKENFLHIAIDDIVVGRERDNDVFVLPNKMIDQLMTIDSFTLDPEDKSAYDYSIIALFTTYRISDMMLLTDFNARNTAHGMLIWKTNLKPIKRTEVLLPKFVADLLNKNKEVYGSMFATIKSKYPSNPSAYFNGLLQNFYFQFDCMKELQTVEDVDRVRRTIVTKQVPIYKLVTSHIFRKTGITYMLANGMSESHVKAISGHSKNSNSFGRYQGLIKDKFEADVMSYHAKIAK